MADQPANPSGDLSSTAIFRGNTELAELMRSTNWSATALGPADTWPQSLQSMIRMMLASRYQMWLGWGPDLNFFYNDAYRPTLGIKHPRSLGAPTRELWSEIWDDIGPRIQHVLSTGEATWDEGLLLLLERSGYREETYHTFSYSPIFDDAGRVGGMLSVVTEETERVISERRLALVRELSSRLAATQSTPEVWRGAQEALAQDARDLPFTLLYLFDETGETATLVARTGMPPEHPAAIPIFPTSNHGPWPLAALLRGDSAHILDPLPAGYSWPTGPWARPPQAAVLLPISQQGHATVAGVMIAGVNPHRPLDEPYRSFLHLLVGQIASALANARAYEAERRRAEALAEIDRAKTIFFSNVSHEFRTPLTLMLGPLDDLSVRADVTPEIQQQLSLVRRNGARLLRLVNTLLDFSRIEAGRANARYEPLDLAEYTRDLVSTFASATERAGLGLVVDAPPVGERVYVDRAMWEKVVLNLVSNAFKFTLQGEIHVSLQRAGEAAMLTVRDTGTGIPSTELPRLFERFHRVEGARGRTHEGTGIGLALVQELVKLHGGAIAVESELGRGSVFTVSVPLGRRHLPQERIAEPGVAVTPPEGLMFVEEALQWLPHQTGDQSLPAVPAAATVVETERILLADDSADMRDYIARLLQPRWHVSTAPNGLVALEMARRDRPHLVIADVMMPELDGFGLIQALRVDPETRDVPILLLSARAGEESRIEGLEAGADDYLVKPFSARELLARVEAQLLRARVRAVEEVHARRLATVFAQAPVAIALLRGPEHVYELANSPYMELVGQRSVVGKPLREALPEVVAQGVVGLLDRIYASGEAYTARSYPVSLRDEATGTLRQRSFDVVFQPLKTNDGQADSIAVVAYDVTDLARARHEAEVASRAKDEFLAMLGHELRNPLAPILTALQLLRLRGVDGAERERQVIERQVQHLVKLVDDLLDVSRITRGKVQIRRVPTEIADVVARAVEMASPLLERHHHTLLLEVPRVGLLVDADAGRLSQVVSNLLANAAKYTEPGGTISVTAKKGTNEIVLTVRDTGIGIAADMLPQIFELFVQERQALDRAGGGLGLGLAIARSLVQLHDGTITARSDGPGRGAEFTIQLPASPQQDARAANRLDGYARPVVREPSQRVLIVDDNEDAAAMMAEALTMHGHVIRIAADGPGALTVASEFNPDLALLDIGLPVMDGYELARRLHDTAGLSDVPLIAVTGYGQEQDRQRSAAAGFAAHLVKPIDINHLLELVASLRAPDAAQQPLD